MKKEFFLSALCLVLTIADARSSSKNVEVAPPATAYIQKLTVDPTNPATVYAATRGAGLYRSFDTGTTWVPISPSPDFKKFNVIATRPDRSETLLSGGTETGLWSSPDQGEHWYSSGLAGISVLDLSIDPENPLKVFVLAPNGVYRTENVESGDWTLVFDYSNFLKENRLPVWPPNDWNLSRFQGIAINPHNPRVVAMGARWEGGYHLSDDGGETWRHYQVSPIFTRVDRIDFDPVDPSVMYAATHHQGLFKSFNYGQSWVSMSRGLQPQKRTPNYGAVLVSGLAFDPADNQTLYAGSDFSNWKSSDGGRSWGEVGITLTCEFARSFAISPSSPKTILAGTNVGVFRSTDNGVTWTSANLGFPTREILDSCEGTIDGELFEFAVARGRPAVFRRSVTRNSQWASISWLLYSDASSIRFDPDVNALVIETPAGELTSHDGGLRWDIPGTEYVDRFVVDPEPVQIPLTVEAGLRAISLIIQGAPFPDDTQVNELYQRPPYIRLQLVGSAYPVDGSEPIWSGYWDSDFSGLLKIPDEILNGHSDVLLYVEVRDFQWGTLTGWAPLIGDPAQSITVQVHRASLLPSLQ